MRDRGNVARAIGRADHPSSAFFGRTAVLLSLGFGAFFVLSTVHFHRIGGPYLTGIFPSLEPFFARRSAAILCAPGYYPPLYDFLINVLARAGVRRVEGLHLAFSLLAVAGALALALRPDEGTGGRSGWLAFAIYLGWPGTIGLAKFATMDALFLFLVPLTLLLVGEWGRRRTPARAFLAGVVFGLGMLAKWTFWVFVAVPVAVAVGGGRGRGRAGLAFAGGTVLAAGWWYALYERWTFLASSVGVQPLRASYARIVAWYLSLFGTSFLGPVGAALLVGAVVALIARRDWRVLATWGGGGVLVPIVLLAAFKNAETRYLSGGLAPLTVFVCRGLGPWFRADRRGVRAFALVAALWGQGLDVVYGAMGRETRDADHSASAPFVGWRLIHPGVDVDALKTELEAIRVRYRTRPEDGLYLAQLRPGKEIAALRLAHASALDPAWCPAARRFEIIKLKRRWLARLRLRARDRTLPLLLVLDPRLVQGLRSPTLLPMERAGSRSDLRYDGADPAEVEEDLRRVYVVGSRVDAGHGETYWILVPRYLVPPGRWDEAATGWSGGSPRDDAGGGASLDARPGSPRIENPLDIAPPGG